MSFHQAKGRKKNSLQLMSDDSAALNDLGFRVPNYQPARKSESLNTQVPALHSGAAIERNA
jgi:hypothetical protein